MAKKRRRSETSGSQIIQVQRMFQNLLEDLDAVGVQRLLESRDVLMALADGRLTAKKALATLGMPVRLPRRRVALMDFFGLPKAAEEAEVLSAFTRQGMRPATDEEYERFLAQHRETVVGLLRNGLALVVMGEKFTQASFRPRGTYLGYPIYSAGQDDHIDRHIEGVDSSWDKTHRFLGVRTGVHPELTVIPTVSATHISPKVRPSA